MNVQLDVKMEMAVCNALACGIFSCQVMEKRFKVSKTVIVNCKKIRDYEGCKLAPAVRRAAEGIRQKWTKKKYEQRVVIGRKPWILPIIVVPPELRHVVESVDLVE